MYLIYYLLINKMGCKCSKYEEDEVNDIAGFDPSTYESRNKGMPKVKAVYVVLRGRKQ